VRQAQWRFRRQLPRASTLGARDLQPGVTASCSFSARVGVSKRRGGAWRRLFGAIRRGRGREARRGLQPGDVRSSLRRAPAGEGAEAHDIQLGEVFFRTQRRGQEAGGGARGDLFGAVGVGEGAKRSEICSPAMCGVLFGARRRVRARRRTIFSPARCSARVGVGEGAVACVVVVFPRRVSAWAKTRLPAAPSTSGGLGRYGQLGSPVAFGSGCRQGTYVGSKLPHPSPPSGTSKSHTSTT